MLIQTSLPNSIKTTMCFVNHVKKRNLGILLDYPTLGETWYESYHDKCQTSNLDGEKEENDVTRDILASKTSSSISSVEVAETSPIKQNNVYKRRKFDNLRKVSSFANVSDDVLTSNINDNGSHQQNPSFLKVKAFDGPHDLVSLLNRCDDVSTTIVSDKICEAGLLDGKKSVICQQRSQQMHYLATKSFHSEILDVILNVIPIERTTSLMDVECEKTDGCFSYDVNSKSKEKSHLEQALCDSCRTIDTSNILVVDDNASSSRHCTICGLLDDILKLLICDLCEKAFHMLCCNPRFKTIPSDEWHCQPCKRRKPKPLLGATTATKPNMISQELGRRKKVSPIVSMLEDMEPYTTGVRIGEAFQADIPNWAGPISKAFLCQYQVVHCNFSHYTLCNSVLSDFSVSQEMIQLQVLRIELSSWHIFGQRNDRQKGLFWGGS